MSNFSFSLFLVLLKFKTKIKSPTIVLKSLNLLLLYFLLPFSQVQVQGEIPSLNYNKNLHFVPGTFAEYLPDPLFYDTYVPLLFEFNVPRHMESALKIMWQHATVCNATDSRYDGKLCPVIHHLHKVIANLSSEMGFWKDFLPYKDLNSIDLTSSTQPSFNREQGAEDVEDLDNVKLAPNFCRQIAPHFFSYYTSKKEIDRYLRSLERCPLGESVNKAVIKPPTWIVDKQIYYTMVDRFYVEFYRTLPATGNVDWVTTLNSYTTLSGILLSNNYMESNRVLNAILQCQNGLIPHPFIKKSMLKSQLQNLEDKIHSNHYEYLWEKESQLSHYYKLPLADCTLTDDFKLLVRIQIPLEKTESSSKLLELRAFPFVERLKGSLRLCRLQGPEILQVVESSSGLLLENGACQPNKLCKRSDLNSFLPGDSCMSSILSNNDTMIKTHCHLNCYPVDEKSLPIFQRKGTDSFIVVGSSDHKIFIQCNGQPLEQILLTNVGALEIRLSCNCQISYRNLVFQPLDTLCKNEAPSVSHILPLQWDQLSNHTDGDGATIDENWILDNLEKKDLQDRNRNGKYYEYGVVNLDDEDVTGGSGGKKKSDKQAIYQEQIGEDNKGLLVQLSLLWFLIVALAAVNIFLGYQVIQLIKWKKIQVYKDTRIVYSVPASPQFPNKF